MRPKRPAAEERQDNLFRLRLEAIIDTRHPLVRLGGVSSPCPPYSGFDVDEGSILTGSR